MLSDWSCLSVKGKQNSPILSIFPCLPAVKNKQSISKAKAAYVKLLLRGSRTHRSARLHSIRRAYVGICTQHTSAHVHSIRRHTYTAYAGIRGHICTYVHICIYIILYIVCCMLQQMQDNIDTPYCNIALQFPPPFFFF